MSQLPRIINILPLGDSITDGAGTHSGYRFFLHNLLIKSGISFRFVGPKKTVDPRMADRYQNHAGYGGNTIGPDNSRSGNIFSRLPDVMKSDVDIVLLMMGRNNYFQAIDLDRIDEVYYNFVHEVIKYKPDAHIFVGTMNYSKAGNSPDDPALSGLNALLPSVCDKLKAEGHNVYFVDIATCSNLGQVDFKPYDNTHPNDIGQEKIAKVWFDNILPIAKKLNEQTEERSDDVKVSGLKLNQSELSLKVGDEYQLATVFLPETPYEFTTLWESNSDAVTIDSLGRITAKKCGNATITATHVKSGLTAKCNVSVNEAVVEQESVIVDGLFSNADNWTGDTSMISDNKIVMWFIRRELSVSTKEKFNLSNRFKVRLDYMVNDNRGVPFGNYLSFKLGGLEVRIIDGVTSAQVLFNGEVLGEWNSYHEIETRTYTLCYDNGQITLLKGGETLITVNKCIDFTPSSLEIYSNEGERFCVIGNISISNII
ncbi:MAG: Ig-like domain-containing protein [Clostridia bacterium]|nr:Ig-like domain-containing protein [Clostridia bacterium]